MADYLLKQDYKVVGMEPVSNPEEFERIRHIQTDIEIVHGDLLDQGVLEKLLTKYNPNEVYNLAAQSFMPAYAEQAVRTGEVTALGVLRLLEAIRNVDSRIRFFQASSSEMYGKSAEVSQSEGTPFNPLNLYAIAKVYGHWVTGYYRENYNLFACSGILYNHESPRRALEFVTRKITHGVAMIKLGLANGLRLGNLESRRDWGFAGDYVQAMWRMLQQSSPSDYVIATGETHSVREFCEVAFECVGLNYERYVIQDHTLSRTEDYLRVGNPAKAFRVLGWQPAVKFRELVQMMVDADLQELRAKHNV